MSIAVVAKNQGFDSWSDGKRFHTIKLLQITGAYVTGGDLLNLGTTAYKSNTIPLYISVQGTNISKYEYDYVPGTNINNGKVRVTDTTTGLELAAGAYPATITSDVVTMYAITLPGQ